MAEQFGRYELGAEIGRGGMAQLFLARLIGIAGFEKPLAIKRILPHLTKDQRFVEMFLNEARIAAKLSHPNICQVYELGEVDGELFLAMEYLEGVPWGELVTTLVANGSVRDPIAILRLSACAIGQACDALHYAHELRDAQGRPTPVVHRDISPGNLFVTVDGICKILDFGVSKIATDQHDTRSGLVKGKLTYMPPEQLKGKDVDARVDVFATSVVLWEALTGKRLFMRSTDYLIFQAILEEPIPAIGHLFPGDLGPKIDRVLAKGLARDREQRYSTIRELGDDLRALVAPLGGVPPAIEIGKLVRDSFEMRIAEHGKLVAQLSQIHERDASDATTLEEAATDPSVTKSVVLRGESVAVPRRRSHAPIIAAAGLGVIVIAVVVIVFITGDHSSTPAVVANSPADAAVVVADDAPTDTAVELAEQDIEIDPQGSAQPAPAPRPRPRPQPVAPTDARPGFYSVDSNPYATVFIDGKKIDQTPLYRIELAPGPHKVRAVLANGHAKSFAIKIAPGKEVTSGTLRW